MRRVHAEGLRERANMRVSIADKKRRLNEEHGEPCSGCGVRVDREVLDGVGNVEYPAGAHAIGCPDAEPGSYHPEDPRRED